ncbi:MAG: glycosyl hydrolase, partial [Rubripirellula sp.]
TMVHQPWAEDVLPGMTMGPWGFQNNRNNTWYELGRAWNQYLARSQYLLQQGTFQDDLCYFPGENAPQTLATRENMNPPVPQGYDYDTISRNNFMKLTVENGRIVLPGLMQYRVLVMPAGPVRLDVFEKAQSLLEDGGHLVWAKPKGTPGLKNHPQSDQAMRQAAEKIWGDCDGTRATDNVVGKGKVYWPGPLGKILTALNVGPDVEFQSIQPVAATLAGGLGYEWIHRNIGSADVYLVSNQQEVARQVEVVFRSQGRAAQLWNAETGEIQQAPVYEPTNDGRTRVKLFMEPAEAVFVVFDKPADSPSVVDVLHNGSTPFANPAPKPKKLTIVKATYGDLDGDASRQADVTKRIQSEVANNMLQAEVKYKLVGVDPAFGTVKQLRVDYALDDEQLTTVVKQNETIVLNRATDPVAAPDEPATLSVSADGGVLNAWEAGDYELVYSDGKRKQLKVSTIPEPVDLSSDWNLQCPKGWGPTDIKLDKLMSWTQHDDPELKYFSGTAVYQKQFDVPANRLGQDHSVRLDLGDVQIFAEVTFNGKNLGTLWKPPYVVDVSGLVKPNNNQLEIRVTNLWVNRLIGDEQFPSPYEYEPNEKPGEGLILKIPGWLEGKGKRPETQAKTFTVWKFHTKDSPLLDSGLIGPVQLEFAVRRPFDLPSAK